MSSERQKPHAHESNGERVCHFFQNDDCEAMGPRLALTIEEKAGLRRAQLENNATRQQRIQASLWRDEGLTYREIARRLGVTPEGARGIVAVGQRIRKHPAFRGF